MSPRIFPLTAVASLILFGASWLPACTGDSAGGTVGTSTGNPSDGKDITDIVPLGAVLVKSDLQQKSVPLSQRDADALARGNHTFSFSLLGALASADENAFISPYSIQTAFAMTYAGARGNTAAQMRDVLHLEVPDANLHATFNAVQGELGKRASDLTTDSSGQGFALETVNQAWGMTDYRFESTFLDVLAENYGTGIYTVDFAQSEAARDIINDWVLAKTQDRVKDLLPPGAITGDTRLVLTNAIYFKANWLNQFDAKRTVSASFTGVNGDRTVQMMQNDLLARYSEDADYQAIELPYLSPKVRVLFVLPAVGKFADVRSAFDGAYFERVLAALSERMVDLRMPRFSLEYETKLKEPLTALGMADAFTAGTADLTGINSTDQLYIDEAYHKTFLAIDEVGTEAAAATAVVVVDESAHLPAQITLNRPFLFAIYDQPTGQILFAGQLVDPER